MPSRKIAAQNLRRERLLKAARSDPSLSASDLHERFGGSRDSILEILRNAGLDRLDSHVEVNSRDRVRAPLGHSFISLSKRPA